MLTRRVQALALAVITPIVFEFGLLEVQADGPADDSPVGLYIQIEMTGGGGRGPFSNVNSTRHNYLYLFPDGNFYEGFIFPGYDELDFAKYLSQQHPLRVERDAGRYTVNGDQVEFRYVGGGGISRTRKGNTLDPGLEQWVRQPNCDGLKLSGTYLLSGFGNLTITFTPDGRFVDGGAIPQLLVGSYLGVDAPAAKLRPGPGTYSIKNHTITLRYAQGPVFRLFFYAKGDDRGEIDPSSINIYISNLVRQGGGPLAEQPSIPSARLPKLEVPQGWTRERDPSDKKTTYFTPPNLSQGRVVAMAITDPQPLPNPDSGRFPGRLHDAGVQGVIKNYKSMGYRTERELKRDTQGNLFSSSGVYDQADGKRLWLTIFTLCSSTQWQSILFISNDEDLYKAHLPTVRTMLGDTSASPHASTTSLAPAEIKRLSTEVYLLAKQKGGGEIAVVFENGTFRIGFPYEGLDAMDQKRLIAEAQPERKGTYRREEKKLTLRFGQETEAETVVLTPERYGWKDEEENKLIKMPPVEDFQFDGTFAPVLDSPTTNDPTLSLTRDGRFVDRGIFRLKELSTPKGANPTSPPPVEGKGEYSMRNYTLILSYENGAERRVGIMALPLDNDSSKTTPFFLHYVPFKRQ